MKNNIIVISILLICSNAVIPSNTFSQFQFFDSVTVAVSSNLYDYKNPVFENGQLGYIFTARIAYERHHNGYSDIIIRSKGFNGYDSEIVITDFQNSLNINPSFSQNILVWQSNIRGNWDLFYSIYLNNHWSQPQILDSSSSDETNPFIRNNNTAPLQYNNYYLVYKRDNYIRFKKYRTILNAWEVDTNVTADSNEYITPILIQGPNGNQYTVFYLREYTSSLTRINGRIFNEPLSSGSISWENPYEVEQPNSQTSMTIAKSDSRFISFSYDTLGSKHILGFNVGGQNFREVLTKNIPGRHYIGKAAANGVITDNSLYFFDVMCTFTLSNDSSQLTFINQPNSFNSNPEFKKIYLGDTSLITRYDLSPPIYNQNLYKISAVWEKQIGGRTALVESYMTDFFTHLSNKVQSAETFNLSQNYPNPFNPVTNLEFGISNFGFVTLKVYDVLGNEVKTLVNENKPAGRYTVTFDGSNLSSGIYFYKLVSGAFAETKQMVLIK